MVSQKQVALAQLLAQVGCFVPAESAALPCADALFVRSGARDDLAARRSTLLVEMEEAAHVRFPLLKKKKRN